MSNKLQKVMKTKKELSVTAFVAANVRVMKGICTNCTEKKRCGWVADQKTFCEHYN